MNLSRLLTNPRYLVDRISVWNFERTHTDMPWLTRDALNILSTWLKPTDQGLEWGSGRSTLWFAKRVKHLVSVEDHAEWSIKVREMLRGVNNVDFRQISDEATYVGVADTIEPESLDFALVDGNISRDLCARRAVSLLKPGGMLILDNANWWIPSETRSPSSRRHSDRPADAASWDALLHSVASWRHIWTSNGVHDTAMWVRP